MKRDEQEERMITRRTLARTGALGLAGAIAAADTGIAARERLRTEGRVELVPQCLASAGIDPGDMLRRRETEWHRRIEHRRRLLALPVECGRVTHLSNSGPDRIEHFESRHDLARGVHCNLQPSTGQR
jgi:hypothetical protein